MPLIQSGRCLFVGLNQFESKRQGQHLGYKSTPRNQTKVRVGQIRIAPIPTQEIPFTFGDVMAFLSIRFRNHSDRFDVLLQFELGLENVRLEEFSNVSKLAGDELPDAPDLD